jgi:hypothetical protein
MKPASTGGLFLWVRSYAEPEDTAFTLRPTHKKILNSVVIAQFIRAIHLSTSNDAG